MPAAPDAFVLPTTVGLSAVAVFALSGATEAIRRGYDFVGIVALAFATALGGALMRDSLLGFTPPPLLTDGRYLIAVGIGGVSAIPFYRFITRLPTLTTPMLTIDALGLAAFTIVGTDKALAANVAIPGVIFIGVLNGVGGSILRDILTRQEPLLFRPGQYYALASIFGAVVYVALHRLELSHSLSAPVAITAIFAIRMASVRFNWRTRATSAREMRPTLHSGRR